MSTLHPEIACAFCHSDDFEVLRNDVQGLVVICLECGYAQRPTLQHLLAS